MQAQWSKLCYQSEIRNFIHHISYLLYSRNFSLNNFNYFRTWLGTAYIRTKITIVHCGNQAIFSSINLVWWDVQTVHSQTSLTPMTPVPCTWLPRLVLLAMKHATLAFSVQNAHLASPDSTSLSVMKHSWPGLALQSCLISCLPSTSKF